MEILLEYMAKGFVVMLTVAMPCVLIAAAIGLVVGILQAVTQVQEQTIAAAPKILGVFLCIMILGVTYVRLLTNLFQEGSAIAFNIIPKSDAYVLEPDYYKYTKPFANEMKWDEIHKKGSVKEVMNSSSKTPFKDEANDSVNYGANKPSANPQPNFMEKMKLQKR